MVWKILKKLEKFFTKLPSKCTYRFQIKCQYLSWANKVINISASVQNPQLSTFVNLEEKIGMNGTSFEILIFKNTIFQARRLNLWCCFQNSPKTQKIYLYRWAKFIVLIFLFIFNKLLTKFTLKVMSRSENHQYSFFLFRCHVLRIPFFYYKFDTLQAASVITNVLVNNQWLVERMFIYTMVLFKSTLGSLPEYLI